MILILLFTSTEGCTKMNNKENLGHLSFSHDGKKLLFYRQYKENKKGSMINVYNRETGELSAYEPPQGEAWSMAKYSFDGKRLVFVSMPLVNHKYDMIRTQIAIMDVDGRNYKKITNDESFKISPSFSHDGKKVVYCKADEIRKSGKTPAAGYDLYEIDIDTGQETRITNLKLYSISTPYYFPDDESIIFSTYSNYGKMMGKYEDDIYVIKKGQRVITEPFIASKYGLRNPLITVSGKIYFQTHAINTDGSGAGYQIFQYSRDGMHQRITNIPASTIWSEAVTPDGKWLAVVYGIDERKIVIYNLDKLTSQEIDLPDKPSIIIKRLM
jgi:Tol biopolymer transport system component